MEQSNIELEITVRFRIKNTGTREEMHQWCKDIGVSPSLISYVRWLANEEGLMGIVEDGYVITNVVSVAHTAQEISPNVPDQGA